ncbi:MAG TPA: HlyD family efflux transporter periplasmic adaptor subunit [Chitinivibrionales bacterium]|jgi:HlyD family secretion protein|nr:HlyD family efflux transporter periplasmic adaptor subunit [Chitinivibrionales bacterium]
MNSRQTLRIICSALPALAVACSPTNSKDFIGSAVAEAQTYQIATTAQGTIVALYKEEGQNVNKGELVAVIDTVPTMLRLAELSATLAELNNSISAKKVEVSSQESDVKGVEREYKRITTLVSQGSAPSQQKDNLETQVESSNLRVQANRTTLAALQAKINTINAQRAELLDQLSRCYVRAPASGTVLTKYKNLGEVALPGNSILEIGKYDTMQVDFYVTQPMLPSFKLSQNVRLRLDNETPGAKEKQLFLPAQISWISSDAEFSPKNIQTRESRNELVFKIRAMAANTNGQLKRGLPVEVWR